MNYYVLIAIALVFPISFFIHSYISKVLRKKKILSCIALYISRIEMELSGDKKALDFFRRWKYWITSAANNEVEMEINTIKTPGTSARICLYSALSRLNTSLLTGNKEVAYNSASMLSIIENCLDSMQDE